MPSTLAPVADALDALARALRAGAQWSEAPAIALPPQVVGSARYVTVDLAARLTGYTAKAIRRKIGDGIWREGREWRKAPDGRVLISLDGYTRWVEGR